jgi:membrane protease YdiL (CAAX protease family)
MTALLVAWVRVGWESLRVMIYAYRRAAPVLAVCGLCVAVALRVQIAGVAGASSQVAGVWFAAALVVVAWCTHDPGRVVGVRLRHVGYGVAGAVVLCVPAAVRHVVDGRVVLPLDGYLSWALIVTIVAVAEESLLRGSLFTVLERRHGTVMAVAVTSAAFALLHAPVYGWAVVPLDLTVGVWLGALRAVTGSVTAPALAHSVADLAGWWLR